MAADGEKGDVSGRLSSEKESARAEHVSPDQDNNEEQEKSKDVDIAERFLKNLDPAIRNEPITQKEARRVLWKVDFILIPMIMVTAVLAALDKVIISNAAIYGMTDDTNLGDNEFSWVGSIFYFGYLIFEYPVALLIQRLPVAKFYSANVLAWGILLLCTAATQNFAGLASVRFLMGMMEACVFPISSILTVMWWTNTEQPIRVAWWFNQLSSVFSGTISYGIGHADVALAPWRLLFLVLGGFTLLWAAALFTFLPDSPVKCWYMSDREKYICLERVKGNNTGVEDKTFKWYQVRECLVDPKAWLLILFSLLQNIPNGGLITFSSIIVSGMGYSPLITTVLGIPTGVLATVWQLILSLIASRIKNSRCTIIAIANLVPMLCAILMWKLPQENESGLLGAYYVFYTYWGPYVLATSLPMANISGHSKKVTFNALFFIAYCVGNIIGPQLFRDEDAPEYRHGYEGILACIIVAIVTICGYAVMCRWENSKRDREQAAAGGNDMQSETEGESVGEGGLSAFSDRTDGEKRSFRYIY